MSSFSGRPFSWRRLCSGTFMIFGTTVGAGMLGIPAMTAQAGFYPAIFMTVLVWLFMLITGLLLLEVTFRMPSGANVISLAGRFLGVRGKWVAGLLFLFLYGCLLVAYFSGGAPLLEQFFSFVGMDLPSWLYKVFFAVIFGGVIFLGAHWINRVNLLLSLAMFFSYACLLSLGSQAVHREYLSAVSFSSSLVAVPVLFSAFGFHNVIPSLAHYLKQEKRTLRLSLILGTFLAFVFYTIWQWLVLGTVPLEALEQVRQAGLPVTYALQMASSGANIYVIGQIFAFLALTTSFLGVGFSFVDFLKDGFHSIEKEISRALCSLLTILPPLIFVLWIPALFEKALGVAGGFGESLLNGVLPVLLFTQMRALCYKSCPLSFERRSGLSLLIILSFFVVALELQALLFG